MEALLYFLLGLVLGLGLILLVLYLLDRRWSRAAAGDTVFVENTYINNEIVAVDDTHAVTADYRDSDYRDYENMAADDDDFYIPADFTITRQDILDYMDEMEYDPRRYPLKGSYKLKNKIYFPDSLLCKNKGIGFLYEKKDGIKLIIRVEDQYADALSAVYDTCYISKFPKGKNWFAIVIDNSFRSKQEVFQILDNSYDYVHKTYYPKKNKFLS